MVEDGEEYVEVELEPKGEVPETPREGPACYPCASCQAECVPIPPSAEKARTSAPFRRQCSEAGAILTCVTPYELQKIAKHKADEERGQMSYEAHRVRGAKDTVQRAGKVKTGSTKTPPSSLRAKPRTDSLVTTCSAPR